MKNEYEGCSQEIDALLRFFGGRKLISKKDILEFSRTYNVVETAMQEESKRMAAANSAAFYESYKDYPKE